MNQPTAKRKVSKTKNWYKIVAPKVFNDTEIGEALAFEPETLKGRVIKANYSEIAKDITKHHITCLLRINEVSNGVARTEFIGYSLSKPFLQRAIRRNTSKIEEVVDIRAKDKDIRLKCLVVSAYKANTSQRTALRHSITAEVRKILAGYDLENTIVALASGKPQKEIGKKVRIIFPIKFFEVRKVEILNPKKVKKDLSKEAIVEVVKRESRRSGKKIKIEPEGEDIKEQAPTVSEDPNERAVAEAKEEF